jgi:uncharacterized membrane protein YwzB
MSDYLPIILYFLSFGVCLYALMAIDFKKFIYPSRTLQTQALVLILAMALAYLITQFLLGLRLP